MKNEEFSPSNRKSPLFTVPLDIREPKFCMGQRERKQIFSGDSRTNVSVFVACICIGGRKDFKGIELNAEMLSAFN